MLHSSSGLRAVIVTALPVEYDVVCAYLQNLDNEVHRNGTTYVRGTFSGEGQQWDVALIEIGAGNVSAALETERVINYINPRVVLFVGVAGGLKDVKIGDVVAATKVYAYESGKSSDISFQPKPIAWCSSYFMEQRARAEASKDSWLKWLKKKTSSQKPRVFVASIAIGDKIKSSMSSNIDALLREKYGDALAIEIEDQKFLQVVHSNQFVETLVIRGISDLNDGRSQADTTNTQRLASEHASAFALQILTSLAKLEPESERTVLNLSLPSNISVAAPLVAPNQPDAIKIFYTYAHEDEKLVNQLQSHLLPLKRRGLITDWHGGRIAAGESVTEERMKQLDSAQIILLLVSPDFMTSDYCHDVALAATERHKEKEAVVIPVILRPTDWEETPFSHFQPIPRGNKPIVAFSNRDEAFSEVAKEIRAVVERLKKVA